jgi:hypothetical protein
MLLVAHDSRLLKEENVGGVKKNDLQCGMRMKSRQKFKQK